MSNQITNTKDLSLYQGPQGQAQPAAEKRKHISPRQKTEVIRFLIKMERELAAEKPPLIEVARRAARELGWKVKPEHVQAAVQYGAVPRWWPGRAPGAGRNYMQLSARLTEAEARVARLESEVAELRRQLGCDERVPAPPF